MQQADGDDNSINRRFGEAVTRARNDAGLTQAQLAEKLGSALGKTVNTPTINRLEKGTRPTPIHEAYALADVLGVDVDLLLPTPGMLQRHLGILESSLFYNRRELEDLRKKTAEQEEHLSMVEGWLDALHELQDFNNGGVMHGDQVDYVLDQVLFLAEIYGDWEDHRLFLEPFGIPYEAAGELLELIGEYQGLDADPDATVGEAREKILKVLTDLFLEYNEDRIIDATS